MAYDGRSVANQLLNESDTRGFQITHMALQKLVYFAHGYHLALQGTPLVKQPFEAWEHGPVLRVVYNAFSQAGCAHITFRATRLDPVTRIDEQAVEPLHEDQISLLRAILYQYGHLHAAELRRLSHLVGGPWHSVWHAPRGKVQLGMRITDDAIRSHFAASLVRQ